MKGEQGMRREEKRSKGGDKQEKDKAREWEERQ